MRTPMAKGFCTIITPWLKSRCMVSRALWPMARSTLSVRIKGANQQLAVLPQGHFHRTIRLAIAIFTGAAQGFAHRNRRIAYPGHATGDAQGRVQHGVILPLGHQQLIFLQILADHKPAASIAAAADAQTTPLA